MTRTASLLTAVAAAAALTVLPASAASGTDAPWSGYTTTADGTAGGGWIGGRTIGSQVVYRLDPGKKVTKPAGFGAGTWTGTLAGSGAHTVTALDTARAAWILGKYGAYKYAIQDAAVDVAVRHLLHGGTWALTGATTKKRLAGTGQAAAITSFASTMLTDSSRYAGPYAVSVTAGDAAPGGQVAVRVAVVASRTGAGVAHLPVTVTSPGTDPVALTTGTDGSASTTLPAGAAGPHQVTATVDRVPETRLQVRTATTPGASRVAVAGLKTTRTTTATAAVRVSPTSRVVATRSPITTTQSPAGQLTISGSEATARTAVATLYGPFDSAAAVTCDPARKAASRTLPVTGNGTYALPSNLVVPRYGYYVWGTSVPADSANNATTACGGTTLARVTPRLTVTPASVTVQPGTSVHGVVSAAGLPTPYDASAELRLYGPFESAADVGCNTTLLLATQAVPLAGDSPTVGTAVRVTRTGYYFWAASLPAGSLTNAASSSCTDAGATFRARW